MENQWKAPADTYALEHGTFYSSSSSYQSDMNAGDDWAEGDTYLNLSNQEKSMVEMVCSNFDQVVVLINSANPMELGWLDDYDSIQSALVVPGTGVNGFNALGSILNGSVNPSGHLVDTYVYDLTAAPYFNNIGNFEYLNAESLLYTGDTSASVGGAGSGMNESYYFVNYVEGIYVGYKFYETADIEGLIKYDDVVQYPFGYGLSYTTFEQSITDVQADGKTVALTVNVKNTGAAAGMSAVEVYYTPPYTNGGIEKASVNLVEFEKTEMLEPGAETSVTISFDYEDMASYDDNARGASSRSSRCRTRRWYSWAAWTATRWRTPRAVCRSWRACPSSSGSSARRSATRSNVRSISSSNPRS